MEAAITPSERTEILRQARELAYNHYLAALLAPPAQREDLIALAALEGELDRIPLQVSEATIGEIRLQWWRDALTSQSRSGNPVADAAIAMQPKLPAPLGEMIAPIIEARSAELYAEPFTSNSGFEAYVSAPVKASFAMRAALLEATAPMLDDKIFSAAARALGLVRTCVRLPHLLAKGRYPLPEDRLQSALQGDTVEIAVLREAVSALIAEAAAAWADIRPKLKRLDPRMRCVLLPVALAGPYLRGIQKAGRDVLRDVAEPSPLERSTRLWLAARLGRF